MRGRRGTPCAALSACLLLPAASAAPASRPHPGPRVAYATYVNVRFAYAVAYPKRVLFPQGEADNGDGQRFLSAHAAAVLTVYGRYNALDQSLGDLYTEAARGTMPNRATRVVTYRALGRNWFVVSGHGGGRIFYEKTLLDGDVIRSLEFVYPARRRRFYDPIAARVAASFRRLSGQR